MVTARPVATAMATSFPPSVTQEALWEGFFARHYAHRQAARSAFFSAGIDRRHAAVNPVVHDLSGQPTGARMDRFLTEALPLSTHAVSEALKKAGLAPAEIGLLTVVSCTGYVTPGVDVRLAGELSMSPQLERLLIGHVGCHAALPGLDAVRHYVGAVAKPAVLLCVELPSLHVQPPSRVLSDVVIHSLFSDAASALVVEPGGLGRSGLAVVDATSVTDPSRSDEMTWTVTDLGFKMTLSRHVPLALADAVGPLVDGLLTRNGLGRRDIDAWAIHPGGPRILDVIADRLGLADNELDASRNALAEHGNCSSASILIVLETIARDALREPGTRGVALAFGPGLTLCATLFERV